MKAECACGWHTPDKMTDKDSIEKAARIHERLYNGHVTTIEDND